MQKKQKRAVAYIALFAVSLAFYLAWYFMDGVILTEDAPSYINMQSDREPGYCLYLLLFRTVFGAELGIHAAVIGQCVIAALAACAVTVGLTELFSPGFIGSAGILAIQYGITLLNRFVAQRRYSYYNSIETEGLAYSLWVFYFLCVLGILYKKDKKSLIGAIIWSIALISIRKQMLITVVILPAVILFVFIKNKGWKKACACALLSCTLCLVGTRLVECSYNWLLRGTFAPHTGDSSFILGTELYVADDTMAQSISDGNDRSLFLEILQRADENEYHISYADNGWQALVDHYSSAYDRIKFDIVMAAIREDQDRRGVPGEEREADYNRIAGTMMRELLLPCLPKLARLYVSNIVHGFVTAILKVHSLLNWAALILYLFYGGSMALVYWAGKKYASRGNAASRGNVASRGNAAARGDAVAWEDANPVYFALLVLFAIAVNVCFTALTIYCQMRYMLYNTGLFYQAWWVMVIRYIQLRDGRWHGGGYEKDIISFKLP